MDKTPCEKMLEEEKRAVPVLFRVTYDRLLDLLTSAFEGGCSRSWIECVHLQDGDSWKDQPKGKATYIQEVPFLGGTLYIEPCEDPGDTTRKASSEKVSETQTGPVWTLTIDTITAGILTMSKLEEGEGGHHIHNFLRENDDAETGDVFLQCCLFGEIVFG